MAIDWTNPADKISDHFTVREALWLPQWNRLANAADGLDDAVKTNLVDLFKHMDWVRDYFNQPVVVHVTYRPAAYNKLIGGAPGSAHQQGRAVDFHIVGVDCDKVRTAIVPKLEEWGMRCEKLAGSTWVHLDTRSVAAGGTRYFIP